MASLTRRRAVIVQSQALPRGVIAIRKLARCALVLMSMQLLVAAPLPALAEDSTVSAGWYFAEQPDPLPPPIGTPAAVPPPDVPAGDWAVAAKPAPSADQQSDKETYLHVDLSAVPAGAKLSALKLTLKEDAAGANLNSAAAVIEAHPVTDFFADGATASPYS